MVFARAGLENRVVLLETSDTDERVWLAVHCGQGPYLLCLWYRPPAPGKTDGVDTFSEELQKHRSKTLGTSVVGDLNVHHRKWLVHSARNTVEGKKLEETCNEHGLRQLVRELTREEYLLDLVLTDIEEVMCSVEHEVSDHKLVTATAAGGKPSTWFPPGGTRRAGCFISVFVHLSFSNSHMIISPTSVFYRRDLQILPLK